MEKAKFCLSALVLTALLVLLNCWTVAADDYEDDDIEYASTEWGQPPETAGGCKKEPKKESAGGCPKKESGGGCGKKESGGGCGKKESGGGCGKKESKASANPSEDAPPSQEDEDDMFLLLGMDLPHETSIERNQQSRSCQHCQPQSDQSPRYRNIKAVRIIIRERYE